MDTAGGKIRDNSCDSNHVEEGWSFHINYWTYPIRKGSNEWRDSPSSGAGHYACRDKYVHAVSQRECLRSVHIVY